MKQPNTHLVRILVGVAVLLVLLGTVALPGGVTSPAVSAMPSSVAAGAAATSSTSQDWADLVVGFGLLVAFGVGLMGWWFTRRGLKFK